MANFIWPIAPVTVGSSPIQFSLDGVDTEVSEDTGTPADSTPLPVKVLDGSGVEADFATEATLQDVLADTDELAAAIQSEGAAKTSVAIAIAGVDQGSVVRGILTDAAGRLDIIVNQSALPDGAATEAKQDDEIAELQTLNSTDFATETTLAAVLADTATMDASLASIAAEDFATETTLVALNAKVTAVNTGAVTISAALPAGNNNIGDVDVASLPSLPAGTNNIGDVDVLTLPSIPAGTNNIGDVDVLTLPALPSGTNSIGSVKVDAKTAVTKARNDYSSVNVTTSAYVQLVASLASAVSEVEIFDSSGQTLLLAVGAAASEVDQIYIFPGGNGRVPLSIASSARVSIKAVSGTASSGEIAVNFYST